MTVLLHLLCQVVCEARAGADLITSPPALLTVLQPTRVAVQWVGQVAGRGPGQQLELFTGSSLLLTCQARVDPSLLAGLVLHWQRDGQPLQPGPRAVGQVSPRCQVSISDC